MGHDIAASSASLVTLYAAVAREPLRAKGLYELADALNVAGAHAESAEAFRKAYRLNPAQRPALSRDADLPQHLRAERLRGYAQALVDHGVGYSSVLSALGVAQSLLGNRQAVEVLYDHDRFLRCRSVSPPAPFSKKTFHAALAEACMSNLRYYDGSERVAFQRGWRNVELMASKTVVMHAFEEEMRRQIGRYLAEMPDDRQHPFIAARPKAFTLDFWAVVSDAASHHLPHIHPRAWLTGVYYVERPDISRTPGTDRGWMTLTPPRKLASAGKDWLTRKIAPEPGNLVLMPGYFFHGTQPSTSDQRRICIAFDVRPSELLVKMAHPKSY